MELIWNFIYFQIHQFSLQIVQEKIELHSSSIASINFRLFVSIVGGLMTYLVKLTFNIQKIRSSHLKDNISHAAINMECLSFKWSLLIPQLSFKSFFFQISRSFSFNSQHWQNNKRTSSMRGNIQFLLQVCTWTSSFKMQYS